MRRLWPWLLVALCLAIFSILGSSQPDGLEKVAERLGFGQHTERPLVAAPLPDYFIPGLEASRLSTPLAGVIGVVLCFLLPFSLYLLRKK